MTFLFANPGYMPNTAGTYFIVKALPIALLKSQQLNVKLPQPVWAWNLKPCGSKALGNDAEVKHGA